MTEEAPEEEFYEVPRRSHVLRVFAVLLALFVAGGLYFGYVFVHTATGVLSATLALDWAPLPPPLIGPVSRPTSDHADPSPTPAPKPGEKTSPPAPGERVNILLLGIDQRPDERGQPSRTDTMLLATMDTATKSGGLLSIPRDLWVAIPGYRDNKINVAHFLGELDKLPGGGPELAKKTVELNFGVPVHYYVKVDFRGFEKLIDILGGVDIDVPKYIVDYEYPTEDYGTMTVEFFPGPQHMDGVRALQYARTRHYDSDFYRNQRQQQVLIAAKKQAMKLDMLPKLPSLLNTIMATVDTDIPITAMPGLAKLASEIDSSNIATVGIEPSMVTELYPGATDLVPNRDEIKKVIAYLMADPKLRAEKAKIQVLNGTTREGLALKVANYLEGRGYVVAQVDKAPRTDYPETIILDHSGEKKATLSGLSTLLRVAPRNIRPEPPSGDYDITVVVGTDAPEPQQ
ncbi:MAG: LCP family protein [Bacteroidetes bacterium]|nr:LCP family protein [Bacteroidota bacterium]